MLKYKIPQIVTLTLENFKFTSNPQLRAYMIQKRK